jgi:phosphate transport system substrate-binding protein
MNLRTRALGAAIAVTAFATPIALQASSPAAAATPIRLTAAGSDTTESVMNAVLAAYAGNATANPGGVTTSNIPALPTSPFAVAADNTCEARTYVAAGNPPTTYTAPNGSSGGRNALKDATNLTNGCIDIARSSSGRGSSDPAGFEYYAFAKDAVSWAAFSGGKAPAALTKAQIKGIYDCTFVDWSEVGGTAGRIQRYLPQAGSGTRSFFQANILDGLDPSTITTGACPAVKLVQENEGTPVDAADRPFAILPYSAGAWVAQANGAQNNARSTATIRSITVSGTKLNPVAGPTLGKYKPNASVVNGGTFPGVRNVYNVLHTDSVAYTAARAAVGFDAANPTDVSKRSPLCNGQLASTLERFGFTPLPANANGVTCTVA